MLHDTCCWLCRSPLGICLTRGKCDHHVEARRRQDADDRTYRTHPDPTANQAVNNIMRAERRKPKREDR